MNTYLYVKGNDNVDYRAKLEKVPDVPPGTYTPDKFIEMLKPFLGDGAMRTVAEPFTAKVNNQTITCKNTVRITGYSSGGRKPKGNIGRPYVGKDFDSSYGYIAFDNKGHFSDYDNAAIGNPSNGFTNNKIYVVGDSGFPDYKKYSITIGSPGITFV